MSLQTEIDNYIVVCENLKGISKLTIKAYKIDLNQFYMPLLSVCLYLLDSRKRQYNYQFQFVNSWAKPPFFTNIMTDLFCFVEWT